MSALAPPSADTRAQYVVSDQTAGFVRANISRVPYLPGLDGMRALAVVAVMVYHANSTWLPGGFLGVEMFFVISGYLITLLLIAERERDYRISLKDFWIRRARRLLPALFVMIVLLTIWTAIFERNALGQLRGDVVGGFFYVSNWYQIWVGLGYTSSGDFAPLRHLWSLAVEEQFYVIWPLVMAAILRRTGSRRIADASRWLFGGAIVITIVVALAYHPGIVGEPAQTPEAYWWIGDRPISKLDTLYLSTFARASGLLLGAGFAMVWRPFAILRGPLRDRGRAFDVAAGVSLVAFGWMCWNLHLLGPTGADGRLFRGGMFLVGVSTLVIMAAVTHQGALANRVLGCAPLVWIGKRSYGLYLFHWPIYQIIRNVAGNKLKLHEFVGAMIVTFAITELSYRLVETPIRTGKFMQGVRRLGRTTEPRTQRLVLVGTALTVGVTFFAGATLATAELRQNDIEESLSAGEGSTTNLAGAASADNAVPEPVPAVTRVPGAVESTTPPTTAPVSTVPVTTVPVTSLPATTAPALVPTVSSVPDTAAIATTTIAPVPETTVAETAPPTTEALVVPATTVPPTTAPPPPAPVAQLGVVTDMSQVAPLAIPVATTGIPLVALGDSVMLGAAEELTANGFIVDAVKSRQLISFIPDLQLIDVSGAMSSVAVVHLGTNGPFSDTSLAEMMVVLERVPIVIVLTGKADRDWVGGNNAKLRALPAAHGNVTVLDWEVLSAGCEGRCFYDDGIHLTQTGQNYYTSLITRVLGLA